MDRRDLLKRTGAIGAGAALAGGGVPIVGAGVAAVVAQTEEFDVWTTYTDEIHNTIMEDVGGAFAEANGLEFSTRGWALEELSDTLPRSVDSDQGPDVSMVNNGEALQGPMFRAGQILSLAEYDAEYGWSERFAPSLLARTMYSADGTTFGEGELVGVPIESEIVGFYYNKQIFADNGLEIPTTYDEFTTLLGALRAADVEPLVVGNLDKWHAIHLFGEIHAVNTTREFLDGLIYRRGDVDFTDPSILDAATRMTEWVEAGYLLDGFEGLSADDAQALFLTGVGGILLQGSWAGGAVRDGLGENAGFFLMPPMKADVPVLHVGGVGIPYGITANAADPDLAAEFIDSLVSEEVFARIVDSGNLPLGEISPDLIEEGTVSGDLYGAWNSALEADAIGHYMDWAAPGFFDPFTAALQEILAGQITPEEFQTKLQDYYAASFS
ncbi:MAG TPA: extracellular solute-binding protein [Thermomicrobiales bacterium]|nr:extracellular solute-binding protein [Thermomicrobiales bacterium]